MQATLIIFSFDTLESASSAREAMQRDGFAAHRLHLRTIEDEAGPVEGNFLIGNGRAMDGRWSSGVIAGPEAPYETNFARTISRGGHLLEVQVIDGDESGVACDCAQRHGGCDVQARNSLAY